MRSFALFTCLAISSAAMADERAFAIGMGISADNSDGFSASAIADVSASDALGFSATLGTTRLSARPEDLSTREWSLGARYDFGPLGFDARVGQSGDPSDFDANDLSVGIFKETEHWRWSLNYLQRDIDLVLRTTLTQIATEIVVPLEADGYRAALRYRTDSDWAWYGSIRRFDYDRDLSPLAGRFIVQRLTPTTLTLASSLLDQSLTVGVEVPLSKQRAINFSLARDELAGGLGDVNSASIGLLLPMGQRGDLDLSIGTSRSDADFSTEDTVFVSVLYLFYGLF
ncbi:MAG: porin [Woeseiaceae bacterium]